MWMEEGTLTREGAQPIYTAQLNQLNVAWNSDNTLETTCMMVQVINPFTNPANQPEANASVYVSGIYYSYNGSGTTDANGRVCFLVKRCELVSVQAFSSQQNNWVSSTKNVMASCAVAGANDCGNLQTCPLVTINLDLVVGRRPNRTR
jgi:hypothetical protein